MSSIASLARDLAHRMRFAAAGGVDKRLERRLADLTGSLESEIGPRTDRRKALGHDTQILREWGGHT